MPFLCNISPYVKQNVVGQKPKIFMHEKIVFFMKMQRKIMIHSVNHLLSYRFKCEVSDGDYSFSRDFSNCHYTAFLVESDGELRSASLK